MNQLPTLGVFYNISPLIQDSDIVRSLTKEFDRSVNTFHNLLKNKQVLKENQALQQKRFGNETIILLTKVYKAIFMSHIFCISLFGSTDHSLFLPREIVYKTASTTVVHLICHKRITSLFSVNGICMLEYNKSNDEIVTAGAKVVVRRED